MELKRDYIDNQEVDKKSFLNLYKIANQLMMNYKNKLMDKESVEILKSIDIDKMIQTRRINAEIIEKKLQDTNANIIYKLSVNDCPLFVPILIKNRDRLRNCLINENIYCPIHWPNFSNFYLGHRTCRYVLWIMHILLLITSAVLITKNWIYLIAFIGQLLIYMIALLKHIFKINNKFANFIYDYNCTINGS